MILVTLALLLLLAACSNAPPATLAIDPAFSAEQRVVIDEALAQWCDSVGWCPRIELDGSAQGRIEADFNYQRHGRPDGAAASSDSGGTIYVDMSHWVMNRPVWLLQAVMHELGHYGAREHAQEGIMSADMDVGEAACLDDAAVQLWCDEQGCDETRGTCQD